MGNNLEQVSLFVIYLFWVRFTFRWLKVTIVICSFRDGLRDDKYVCKSGAWISFFRKTPASERWRPWKLSLSLTTKRYLLFCPLFYRRKKNCFLKKRNLEFMCSQADYNCNCELWQNENMIQIKNLAVVSWVLLWYFNIK